MVKDRTSEVEGLQLIHCLSFPHSFEGVTDLTAILQDVMILVSHTWEEGQLKFSVGCALGIVNEPLMLTSFYILGYFFFVRAQKKRLEVGYD